MTDKIQFPFPCVIDLGLLDLEIGKNCMVLRRKDRRYPHVTFFYEPKPGYDFWWPHITWRARGNKEKRRGLAELRKEHGEILDTRVAGFAMPRFVSVLRPVDVREMAESGWHFLRPSPAFVQALIESMLVSQSRIDFERIEDRTRLEPVIDAFFEALSPVSELVNAPLERQALPVIRFSETEDVFAESGYLHVIDLNGKLSWYYAPGNYLKASMSEMVRTVMPEMIVAMREVAEALDLPVDLSNIDAIDDDDDD